MKYILKGKVWKFGDNIDADQDVLPLEYIHNFAASYPPDGRMDMKIAKHVLEHVNPDFSKKVKKGDILVAGKNFGKGFPHTAGIVALKTLGIVALVTDPPCCYSLRSGSSYGIPIFTVGNVTKKVNQGDVLQVNYKTAEMKNLTTGEEFRAPKLPEIWFNMIEAGGLVKWVRKRLAEEKRKGHKIIGH